jgi:hypothetical protein
MIFRREVRFAVCSKWGGLPFGRERIRYVNTLIDRFGALT